MSSALLRAGVACHRRGEYGDATRHFDAAIEAALPGTSGLPLKDYGLVAPEEDIALACSAPQLAVLLTCRAASALKLGLSLRALADSGMALTLAHSGRRPAFFRALALISIGAYAAAAEVLAPLAAQPRPASRL